MKAHPAAALFPRLSDSEFDALVEDIRENGVQQPVVLYEGMILDGRNRWAASEALGLDCPTREWTPRDGQTPWSYVASANLHRRHLTTSQRAAIAVEIEKMEAEAARERQAATQIKPGTQDTPRDPANLPEPEKGEAREKAAEAMKVSPRSVSDAKRLAETDAERFEAVKRGDKSLHAALKESEYDTLLAKIPADEHPDLRAMLSEPDLVVSKGKQMLTHMASLSQDRRRSIYELFRSEDPYDKSVARSDAVGVPRALHPVHGHTLNWIRGTKRYREGLDAEVQAAFLAAAAAMENLRQVMQEQRRRAA